MEELKLEHLAPYLPYGLKCHNMGNSDDEGIPIVQEIIGLDLDGVIVSFEHEDEHYIFSDTFPILRPLSDLFELVDYNDGNGLVKLGYKYGIVKDDDDYCEEVYADQCESPKAYIPLQCYNFWLFQYHFDVFGLIEKGLAIDINKL